MFVLYFPILCTYVLPDLSPYNNMWWNIHDFTPNSTGDGKNWSILGEMFRITDYTNVPENNHSFQLTFEKSIVPKTFGKNSNLNNLTQSEDEETLIMVFHQEQQNNLAKIVLEKMEAFPEKIRLIQTRFVTMDVSFKK